MLRMPVSNFWKMLLSTGRMRLAFGPPTFPRLLRQLVAVAADKPQLLGAPHCVKTVFSAFFFMIHTTLLHLSSGRT